jgi:drug/metabolite transporter (DMT)-like permease
MKNSRKAIIYALIAVAMWSTVATGFKLSLQQMSLLQLLTGASFVSLIIVGASLYFRGELALALTTFAAHIKSIFLLALLNPILYYIILLKAYDLLPAQVAQSINYTWAITLTLLSVPLLKHKLSIRDIVAIILGYVGVVAIAFGGKGVEGTINILGIFLALLSTIIWAGYWLISARDPRPPLIKLFQSFLVGAPILFIITFFVDGFSELSVIKPWFYIAYIGTFEMGLAFIFWQLAMHHTDRVSQISTLIFLSPLASLFIIQRVLGETIHPLTLLGLALIIGGILFQKYPELFAKHKS